MEGMGKAGVDVTQSLPLVGRSLKEAEFSGSGITHADVTKSLRSQLRKALFDRKALEEFKVTQSLSPDVQLSAKFAAIEQPELDSEASVFYSLKDLPAATEDSTETDPLSDSRFGIDVEQSLTSASINNLSLQNPEESLFLGALKLGTDEPPAEDVNAVLAQYMPTPDELLSQLEGDGLISRAPKELVAPKQPVSAATNVAETGH